MYIHIYPYRCTGIQIHICISTCTYARTDTYVYVCMQMLIHWSFLQILWVFKVAHWSISISQNFSSCWVDSIFFLLSNILLFMLHLAIFLLQRCLCVKFNFFRSSIIVCYFSPFLFAILLCMCNSMFTDWSSSALLHNAYINPCFCLYL